MHSTGTGCTSANFATSRVAGPGGLRQTGWRRAERGGLSERLASRQACSQSCGLTVGEPRQHSVAQSSGRRPAHRGASHWQ